MYVQLDPSDPLRDPKIFDKLEQLGLATRVPLLGWEGFHPPDHSDWVTVIGGETGFSWFRQEVIDASFEGRLDEFLTEAGTNVMSRERKFAGIWGLLLMIVFLPHTALLGLLRMESRPGSPYTMGQALLGGTVWLSIILFVVGLITRTWTVVGLSFYWWLGAKLLEREARRRGYPI